MEKNEIISVYPEDVSEEITENDVENFFNVVSTKLTPEQEFRITNPAVTYPRQKSVLGIHWHPEFIPIELISRRINATFPNMEKWLIIPTQHNVIMKYEDYYGVEVDCYSEEFNQKVQLLLHFNHEMFSNADKLKNMLSYTFKYRSSQLFDFINTIIKPIEHRLEAAARETGADAILIRFVRVYVRKIHDLLEKHHDQISPDMIKNKLLRDFFDNLRKIYGNGFINRVQAFLKEVKNIVKSEFPITYFYSTSEIIEETRSIGGGIVIPHPEQFWPVLLAEYDVDGIEVWNPESRKYSDFLISVIDSKNKRSGLSRRRLLVFMGDDTHFGEKVKEPGTRDETKSGREAGVQSAWEDLSIRKKLILADMDRDQIIAEYKSRLGG